MNINEPLVSVGIPTYNRPEGLKRTLEGITSQSYRNLEIIVSDNASPDPQVREIAEAFAKTDARVRYYRQPENRGAHLNFKFVLEHAAGEFFMWAADDDGINSDYIIHLLGSLVTNTGAALAYGLLE